MEPLTVAQARGYLLHRVVFHPGGSWYDVTTPERRDAYREACSELANRLEQEMVKEGFGTASEILNHAGPYWGNLMAQRILDDIPEESWALLVKDLAGPADKIVENLMFMADKNRWRRIRTEVDFCVPVLQGDPYGSSRIDVLVDRGDDAPMVIDLKTTRSEKVTEAAADKHVPEVAVRYGAWLAHVLGEDVLCRVLMARSDTPFAKWSKAPGKLVSAMDARMDEHEKFVVARNDLIAEKQDVSAAAVLKRAYPSGSNPRWGRETDETVCSRWLVEGNFDSFEQ